MRRGEGDDAGEEGAKRLKRGCRFEENEEIGTRGKLASLRDAAESAVPHN